MSADHSAYVDRPIVRPAVLRTIKMAAGMTWLADFLLWSKPPGLALGLIASVLGLCQVAVWDRPFCSRRAWVAIGMLFVSCAQTVMEASGCNLLVLAVSFLWLFGERLFPDLPLYSARIAAAFLTILRAPARWHWLWKAVAESGALRAQDAQTTFDRSVLVLKAGVPSMAIGTVFAVILSGGNAIFREWILNSIESLSTWLLSLDLSFGRSVFWIATATLALAVAGGNLRKTPAKARSCGIPRWHRADPAMAFWQSAGILVVLNALFFFVNTIDVFYLWKSAAVPHGVSYSAYVHEGVLNLVVAVLLSAVVLSVMFQQGGDVVERPVLKYLSHFWIAQNLVLIMGVYLRLKRYVEAYQLTLLRVYVGSFLLLVCVGFALLAIHIQSKKDLGWLIRTNGTAILSLTFLLQFWNVRGAVADINTEMWRRDPRRAMDLDYMASLGPDAWPALLEIAGQSFSASMAAESRRILLPISTAESARLAAEDWRSVQIRRDRNAESVVAAASQWRQPAN